ncbi:MAG: family hydrolase [Chloroflexi bacterium]|nr:family hydrolase [Chloroflexota bacterium]
MATLRAALFDLGGTLWEWYPNLTVEGILAGVTPQAIRLLSPEQAASLSPEEAAVAVRRAYLELEHAACDGDTSAMPVELSVQRGLASLGVTVDSQTAKDITAALYVSERRTTRLLPRAAEILHELALSGLRLGIISNRMYGGDLLLDDLGYFGISHYFFSIVTSAEAGQMKPHPALFKQALAELSVDPSEAVMIGDDLCADISGALAVGMRAVWVRRPADRTDEPPAGVPSIRTLSELPSIIAAMH